MTEQEFSDLKVGDTVYVKQGFSGQWSDLGLPSMPALAKVIIKDTLSDSVKLYALIFGNQVPNGGALPYDREIEDIELAEFPNYFFKHKSEDILYCYEADAEGKPVGAYYSSFVNRGDDVYVVSNDCLQVAMLPANLLRPLYKNEQYKLAKS